MQYGATMPKFPAVILAGGRATRMGGGDKSLLQLGSGTVLDQVIARLRPQVSDIALNANGDAQRFTRFGVPVLSDVVDGQPGPLAGMLTAMDWAAESGAIAVVTVAADTPFLPDDLVARLGSGPAMAAAQGGVLHPTCGVWPVTLRNDLRAALGQGMRKLRLWAQGHDTQVIEFPAQNIDPFFNINTPEDLAQARAWVNEARSD